MIVFDVDGEIWFALRDVLITLGYSNYKKVGNDMKINKEYILKHKEMNGTPVGVPLHPNTKFINESYQIKIKDFYLATLLYHKKIFDFFMITSLVYMKFYHYRENH